MIGTWNLFVLNMFRGCWKIQQNGGALDLSPLLQLSSHLSIDDSGRKRVSGVVGDNPSNRIILTGQIIATSAEVTPNGGGLVRGSPPKCLKHAGF